MDLSNGYESISAEWLACRGSSKTRSNAIGVKEVRKWAKTLPGGSSVIDVGCGPGFPITVTFPRQTLPRNAVALLKGAAGKSVDIAVMVPDKRSTIAIHPLAPLQPGQTYAVTVGAIINGSEWRQEWQFTTAAKK